MKLRFYGSKKDVEKAEDILSRIPDLDVLNEENARLKIQDAIDRYNLKASILYDGNGVWSRKRIIRNLKQILKHGTLYRADKPKYIPIGSMLRIPTIGDAWLSDYFYKFLSLCCGSIAHYNKSGWIAEYPTVDDLRDFFKKNEYGKPVKEDIPFWKTDAKRIVEDIETLLFQRQTALVAQV